jgi:hypothetical protein
VPQCWPTAAAACWRRFWSQPCSQAKRRRDASQSLQAAVLHRLQSQTDSHALSLPGTRMVEGFMVDTHAPAFAIRWLVFYYPTARHGTFGSFDGNGLCEYGETWQRKLWFEGGVTVSRACTLSIQLDDEVIGDIAEVRVRRGVRKGPACVL